MGEEKGIVLSNFKPPPSCEFSLDFQEDDLEANVDNDLIQLTPANFAFPLLVLVCCGIVSSILQLRHHKRNHQNRHHHRDDVANNNLSLEDIELIQNDND